MSVKQKHLAYFTWMDPKVSLAVLQERRDIEPVLVRMADGEADNWPRFARAHGYQTLARGELREPWFSDDRLIKRCPDLLAICSYGAGYDTIDVEACTKAGLVVCNQKGKNKQSVAEHALGFMLALSKKIALADRALRSTNVVDRWVFQNNDIQGKTLGVVGIGNIGGRLAEICSGAFAMPVLAYDPFVTAEQMARHGARKVEFDELLAKSDFVSVHCPLAKETRGMFGKQQFASMKPTAFFISTARGGIHKEDDLAEALDAGRIAGAGVDVFLEEPPPMTHPLFRCANVVATPHVGGVTDEALHITAASAARQWIDIFDGKVPEGLVNPAAWPRYSDRFERILGFRPAPLP